MRTVELAKAAAQAEVLRLRRLAGRQTTRAIYYAVAGVFAIGALVLLHVVLFHVMVPRLTPLAASAILLLLDLVVAGVCYFLASRNTPDIIEQEARFVRDRALVELKSSLTLATMIGPTASIVGKRRSAGLVLGALATKLLARRS